MYPAPVLEIAWFAQKFWWYGKNNQNRGEILLAAGIVADAITLGDAIHTDLNDADQKLGKLTAQTSASIIGSWGGGTLGAEAGTYGGAMIGSMIFPGPGTLVGGAVGGLVLGIVGSIGGSVLGEWIVDISNIWEWFSCEEKPKKPVITIRPLMHCDRVRLGHIRRAKEKYPIIFFMRTDNFLILIITFSCKPNC